ncbi:hypothetical protein [Collinsella vaginalis]|uniref:hypothetical protein n=1 Tax=Collinsella vaginalis TaxID=1870987 RepID=UPI000A26C3A4|nr:hypothetical protein [Collinsella vaginalis]
MDRIVIESLFPEFSSQGGDNGNIMYLRESLPDAEIIETRFTDEPAFASRDVSMIYLGYMTEAEQEQVAAKLMPYRDRLRTLADTGCVVLFTGNAAEILGRAIVRDDGRTIAGLGLFDFTTRLSYRHRRTEVFLGELVDGPGEEPLEVAGYQIRFTEVDGDNSAEPLFRTVVGRGLGAEGGFEGFRRGTLFATWLAGPVLPLNPLFTEYLIGLLGSTAPAAYRAVALDAYRKRLEEFRVPGIRMPI